MESMTVYDAGYAAANTGRSVLPPPPVRQVGSSERGDEYPKFGLRRFLAAMAKDNALFARLFTWVREPV